MAQTAGKVAGTTNPLLGTALYGGGALLKALQGDPMEKYRKGAYSQAQGMIGKDVINVGGAINQNRAAMIPQLGQMAQGYNKRFGLNSGMAQQQMLGGLMDKEAGFNLNASMQNDMLKSRRDQYLLGILGNAR